MPMIDADGCRAPVRDADDVTRAIDAFAAMQMGGLIVLPSVPAITHQGRIFAGAVYRPSTLIVPSRSAAA
jgi:hypothetical protein